MRAALVDLQGGVGNDLHGLAGRRVDRDDLVVVAVHDERRDVEPAQVLGEVGLGERGHAVDARLDAFLHRHEPERVPVALRGLGARPVGAEERLGGVLPELRPLVQDALLEFFERPGGHPSGLPSDCSSSGGIADSSTALDTREVVPADVAGQLPAAHRVRDQDHVPHPERVDQVVEVVGEGVEVVAVPGLGRAAVPAAVVRDGAVATSATAFSWSSHASALSGQPWLKTTGCPGPSPCSRSPCRRVS